jgi:serine/threonine protein kinase/Tol biopolymer transport system component
MGPRAEFGQHIRFGEFQLDPRTGELWRNGQKFSLQEQPFQILNALLEHPGQLISREDLRKRLWSSSTFVDFEHGLNKAMNRLREVLEDSADQPRFIETLPRRGYRFIAVVESGDSQSPDVQRSGGQAVRSASSPGSFTGRKVSHYRVLEVLGGGGMGVVYKAEDLKLGRSVALKFLPEELSTDEKSLERFEREARAASALDHPNICIVHEFGDHEGQPFMVMQLLEGQTLRDRIAAEGPLPTAALLTIATQVANGLEAAHQKNIIHRDIKPANIFITSRGETKILDFGLAKLESETAEWQLGTQAGQPSNQEWRPTLTLSRTGVAIGTAGYMSPEQVRGEKLDNRTDLFSLGLVLYEMATGQQAFTGETAPVLRDAILNRTPVPARELNPKIPPKLELIINQALEKDRERRYQSATQMRADLERLKRETEPRHSRIRWLLATGGVFAVLAAIGAVVWFAKRPASFQAGMPELKQRQLTTNSTENAVTSGAISPDGRYLAYADLDGIHIKLIETGETRNVPQPDEFRGVQVNWGIISTWVDGARFIANAIVPGHRYTVWVVPAIGGAPTKLRDDAFAGSVSRDGSWVAFASKRGELEYREMWLMRPDGAEARKLWDADPNTGFTGSEWSPDGQRLSYSLAHPTPNGMQHVIESRDLKGGPAAIEIPVSGWDWSWLPDGRMIHVVNEPGPAGESCNFSAIPIDSRTGEPLEKPKRLTNWAGFCMDGPSPSADAKRLVFRRWSWEGTVYVADLEANGTHMTAPRRLTLNEGRNYPAAWTADSKAVVFGSYRDGRWGTYKQSLNENSAWPIVTGTDRDEEDARVSPDGAWLLYIASPREDRSTLRELMRVPIDGGQPQLVLRAEAPTYAGLRCAKVPAISCVIAERSTDRKQLVFTAVDPLNGRERELARFDTDSATDITYVWDLSPDGTSVAVVKFSEGRIRIVRMGQQPPRDIVVKGWKNLQSVDWAADGKALFVSSLTTHSSTLLHVDLQGNAQLLWEQKGSTSPAGRPWDQPLGGPSASWAVPSPDGRHLAIYDWKLSANMWMMEDF